VIKVVQQGGFVSVELENYSIDIHSKKESKEISDEERDRIRAERDAEIAAMIDVVVKKLSNGYSHIKDFERELLDVITTLKNNSEGVTP
jgi:hypothetical protein